MSIEKEIRNLAEKVSELCDAVKFQRSVIVSADTPDNTVVEIQAEKAAPKKKPAKKKAEPKPDPEVKEYTLDEVRSKLLPLSKANGSNLIAGIIQGMGAMSLSALDESQYPELLRKVEEETGQQVQ